MFKKLLIGLAIIGTFTGIKAADAAVCLVQNGCTGTGQIPTTGQILVGTAAGTYTPTSTAFGGGGAVLGTNGVTSTVSGSTTTVSLALNGSSTQQCSTGQGVNLLTSNGLIGCTPFATSTGNGTIVFLANGTAFITTGTINFQQGTNVTITTSTNGTYTISATGGGGGLASTTPFAVGNLVVVSSSGALSTISSSTYYLATNPSGYISSAPATTTITAGGTATGNAFTFSTSTSAGLFNIVCGTATCTFTIPPAKDQFYAPSTTIPTTFVTSFGGQSGVITTNASTGIAITNSGGVHSIQNIGVTSFNSATGSVTFSAPATTTINGATGNAFTFATSGPLLSNITGSGGTVTFTSIPTSTILAGYATSSVTGTGTCTNCNITVNGNGIVTSIANGSGAGLASTTPFISGQIAIVSSTFIASESTTTLLTQLNITSSSLGVATGSQVTYFVAASNAPALEKIGAYAICGSTSDDTCIQTAVNAASTTGGGFIQLSDGTFGFQVSGVATSVKEFTNNVTINGMTDGATNWTSTQTSTPLVQIGNYQVNQAPGQLTNWKLTNINFTMGTQTSTVAAVKVDGGGNGGEIQHVTTNYGGYGFQLEDLDRVNIENDICNNAYVACYYGEEGLSNTYGNVVFYNDTGALISPSSSVFLFGADADQGSPAAISRITLLADTIHSNTGVASTTGVLIANVPTRAFTIQNSLFESNTWGTIFTSEDHVDMIGNQFTNNNTFSATSSVDCMRFLNNGGGNSSVDLQGNALGNCVNAFDSVGSSFPTLFFTGANKNDGNITNMFVGSYSYKAGPDTNFTGANTLVSGLSTAPFSNGYFTSIAVASTSQDSSAYAIDSQQTGQGNGTGWRLGGSGANNTLIAYNVFTDTGAIDIDNSNVAGVHFQGYGDSYVDPRSGCFLVGTTSTNNGTGCLIVQNTSTFNGTVQIVSNNLVDNNGNKYSTSTGSGGGSGNLFVTPTSSVLANNVAVFQTAASSTIKATSSIYNQNNGDVSINSSTDNGLFSVVNASNTIALQVASTTNNSSSVNIIGLPMFLGSSTVTTPTIGGAIVSGGCDSATTTVDSSITSSTAVFITTPNNDPGSTLGGTWAYSFLSAPALITTRVCANITLTPNSTTYTVKIIK